MDDRRLLYPPGAEPVLRAPDPPATTPFDWMSTGIVFPAGGRFLAYPGMTPPPVLPTLPILYPPPQQPDIFPSARLTPAVPEARPDLLPSIPVGWDTQMKIETITPPPPQIEGGEAAAPEKPVTPFGWQPPASEPPQVPPDPGPPGGEARPELVTVPSLEWFAMPYLLVPHPVQLAGGETQRPELVVVPSLAWFVMPLPLLRPPIQLAGGEARTELVEVAAVPDTGWLVQLQPLFPRTRLAPDSRESLPERLVPLPPEWTTAWSLVGRMPSLLYPVRGEPPPAEIVTPEALPDLDWLTFIPPLFRGPRPAPDVPEARDLTIKGLDLGRLTVLPPIPIHRRLLQEGGGVPNLLPPVLDLGWLTQLPDLPQRRQLLMETLAAGTDALFVELPVAEFGQPPDLLVRRVLQLLDAEPTLPEVPQVPFSWMSQQTELPMRVIPLADQLVAFVEISVPIVVIIGATTGPFRASYIPFLRDPAGAQYSPAAGPFRSSYIPELRAAVVSEYTLEIGPYAASYEPDTPPKEASSG